MVKRKTVKGTCVLYKIFLILIGSYIFYYFTNDIKLMIGIFFFLILLFIWGSSIEVTNREQEVKQARGNIEDAFQKRHDILVKLFESTKGLIKYKESELEYIGQLMHGIKKPVSEISLEEKNELQNNVKSILINNIGHLRDDQVGKQFDMLNRSINEVEENLSASRRFFNYAVKEFNSSISSFPTSLIAKRKGLVPLDYFEVKDDNVKKDIEMKF